ncbi:MAG: hypothetical protein L6V93_02775 [Clostridiales bacterium]|nr:MAG: hypothetical protein L6V93_02775 [Clostridiales bacterium]
MEDMTKEGNFPFSPSVVRIVFDRGYIELVDVIGDVEPPRAEMLPKKTFLCYGSSITHGSNAICYSNTWASYLAHKNSALTAEISDFPALALWKRKWLTISQMKNGILQRWSLA